MPFPQIFEIKEDYRCEGQLDPLINDIKSEVVIMVEVGSYMGDSIIQFAKYIPKVFSVDPYIDNYDPVDASAHKYNMLNVQANFLYRTRTFSNIVKMKMKSTEAVDWFPDGSLDFVYIDANHTYESTKEDILIWLPKVKPDKFIGGHDYGNAGFPGVSMAVNESFGYPDKIYPEMSWICKLGERRSA